MKIQTVKISQLKTNNGQVEGLPKNPRFIKDYKYQKLLKSLQDDPEMLELREIIAYDNNGSLVVICGNMRLKALQELGIKETKVKVLPTETSVEKLKAYTIKDNTNFGEYDIDELANSWDVDELEDWGVDLPVWNMDEGEEDVSEIGGEHEDNSYTKEIKAPTYEPKNEKPKLHDLYNEIKTLELIKEIQNSNLDVREKEFLIKAAQRHNVFHYDKIADFYAHSNKEVQSLMEKSALVIIDFDKAIENGYVNFTNEIKESYQNDYC